ncbi:AAA family ATPase [Streptomyces sp. SP17BM10]|uniref:ATP-binding protein n=1 Tax=Streptomyces sp. SP17BM10 TaxID=3002530 RepID=UPI002E75BC8C|nr:AAA family ATPase [Streptomyces sp. SP17BM10]MEE1781471.1 AAA family ATPase [Streptomyces sp. SP17BM10]
MKVAEGLPAAGDGGADGGPGARLHEREAELRASSEAIGALARPGNGPGRNDGGTGSGADGATGEVLLYTGAAGLGKTAVLTEVRRQAAGAGCTVLFARGGEQRRHEPFHVVRQLVQPVLAALSDGERARVLGPWEDIVGPAVGLLRPGGQLDPQGVRDGLDFVLTRLVQLRPPVAVIVDDLHWADPESLGWLAGVAVRARELPALLVLACRDEFPDGVLALERALAAAADRRHRLRPLRPASVARLVREALGDGAEDAFCRDVWSVTAGNPYETTALLREVLDQQLDPVGENAAQLRELAANARGMTLRHWLDKLGPTTLRFAWAASMLGTDIRPELAAAICAQGPETAAGSVRELRRHRVLTGAPGGRLEFVHPLVATSLYQSMPPATRTGMHGVAAVEVENAGLGLLAASRHLLELLPEGDGAIVAKLRRAAREHLAIGAPEAAQRCLRRAISEPPADEDRATVLYELGCSALLTDPATTVNQLRLALAEPDGLDAATRVDATFRLAQALAHSNRLDEAAAVCAEEAARTSPGPGRLRLEVAHFMFAVFQSVDEDGPARSERLAAFARMLGTVGLAFTDAEAGADTGAGVEDGALFEQDGLVHAVAVLRCWDLTLRGADRQEALALAESALPHGRLPRSLGWTNTTWGFELPGILGISYLYADRVDRAEELFTEAVRAYEVAGWSGGHLGFAHLLTGMLRFRCGALAEAEDHLRRALRIAGRIGPGIPLHWDAVGALAETLAARGRLAEALELAHEHGFGPPYPSVMVLPDAPTLYGRLLLARGDAPGAAQALAAAGEALDARGWRNTVWAPWLGHLARAVAGKEPERARALAGEAVRRARESGTDSAIGSALRLSASVHDRPRAAELLAQAVRHLEHSPARYEHALALVDLGEALDAGPDAREALAGGLELAVRCDADGLAERARALLG